MATKEQLEKEIADSEPLAAWALETLTKIRALFAEADAKAPRPMAWNKRERTKQSTWEGIKVRLQQCASRPANLRRDLESMERRTKEAEEVKAKAESEKAEALKRAEAARQLENEAVIWLLARGKEIGKDFAVADAVAVANEIAYNEEIERKANADEMYSFGGDDYCEGCSGWDGKSHRCSCGNRRMSWVQGDSHTFKNPYIYAEAY